MPSFLLRLRMLLFLKHGVPLPSNVPVRTFACFKFCILVMCDGRNILLFSFNISFFLIRKNIMLIFWCLFLEINLFFFLAYTTLLRQSLFYTILLRHYLDRRFYQSKNRVHRRPLQVKNCSCNPNAVSKSTNHSQAFLLYCESTCLWSIYLQPCDHN